jgi:hypothetical protein
MCFDFGLITGFTKNIYLLVPAWYPYAEGNPMIVFTFSKDILQREASFKEN